MATITAIGVALFAALGGDTSTAATAKRVDSAVRLFTTEPYAHGQVGSSNHACEVNRMVRLFKKEAGHWDFKGRDRTNASGKWEIHINRVGYYRALVRPRPGSDPACGGDQSAARPIPS